MKNERLFAIVNHLLEKGRTGAPELARRFEVSVRTIYRDMDSLSANGVPIMAIPGAEGGYEIAEGFRIDRCFLSGTELADLTGALRGFSEALKAPGLASSLGKLSGMGARRPPAQGQRKPGPLIRPRPAGEEMAAGPWARFGNGHGDGGALRGNRSSLPPPPLIVSLTPWGGPSPDATLVELCRQGIERLQPLGFTYLDSKSDTTRRVAEPLSLVLGGAVWYLHAWCRLRLDFRLFRLSRMKEAAFEPGRFEPMAHGSIPAPFATSGAEPLLRIELLAAPERRNDLVETFGEDAVSCAADGRARARFAYPSGEWLLRFLLQFGPGVEVIEPTCLRDELGQAAAAIARSNISRATLPYPVRESER